MTRLLVPVSLEALVVRSGATPAVARTGWASPVRPAAGTTVRQPLAPPPFTDRPSPRPEGVHLHCAVPDALATRGEDGFPPLPSRWLVVRLDGIATAQAARRVTAWLLPNIHDEPSTVVAEGQRTAQRIGPVPAPVTVRGRGGDGPHPSWALDYDDTVARLSFHDPLTDAVAGPIAYSMIGWYTHPRLDPLVPPDDVPATPAWFLDRLARLGWTATPAPGEPAPVGSVYHGSAVALGWPDASWPGDDGGRISAEVGGPPTPDALRTGVADTLVAAVAALLDGDVAPAVAAVSEAVLSGAVAELGRADGAARIDTSRHQARFRAQAPSARTRDVIYEDAPPAPATPPVPDGLRAAVAAAPHTAVASGLATLAAAARDEPAEDTGPRMVEVSYPTPRRWRPGDPVLAVAGLGRTLRHGDDGRFHPRGLLDCRVTGQTVATSPPQAMPDWPVADDVPPEVPDLVRELVALDPGSVAAPDADGAAEVVARAAWWDTWADLDAWRHAPAGTGWTGVLPSPVAVRRPTRPWNPLRLDWEVEADLGPSRPDVWRLGALDFAPADPFPAAGTEPVLARGIGWFSPAPAGLLASAQARSGGAGADPTAVDAVTAALDGFVDRLRGVPEGSWVGARGVVDTPKQAVVDAEVYQPRSHVAGAWRLRRLRAVDTFGQTVTLFDADGAVPQPAAPVVPAELRMPDGAGLALRPRFTAPATLAARFLDPRPGDPAEAVDGRNPVCGFLVPSPFDGTVEVVDAAGTSLARLRPDPRSGRTVLEDTPGGEAAAPHGVLDVVAGALVAADQAVTPNGADDAALATLLRVVAATRAGVDHHGRIGDSVLALLLGSPLCVVRLGLTLDVADPQAGPDLAALTTPVRLGTLTRLDDGVLAWFLEDAPTQVHPVDEAVRAAVAPGSPLVGDPLVWLAPGVQRTVVLLLAPGADVTAVSGLLPQKQLEMVREWTDGPLRALLPTLGFDAVLRDPAAVAMPVPGGVHGEWTWYTRSAPAQPWTAEPVSADPASAQPGTPVAVQDGYLRVTPTPEPPYRRAPVSLGCVHRDASGAVVGVGGANGDGSTFRMPAERAAQILGGGRLRLTVAGPDGQPVDLTATAGADGVVRLSAPVAGGGTDLLDALPACVVPVAVPDVTELPVGEAAGLLAAAGFRPGTRSEELDALPAGHVIHQFPAAGTEAPPGVVELVVSRGPAVPVPAVVGQPTDAAVAAFTQATLRVEKITRRTDPVLGAGLVTEQDPPADALVAAGTTAALVVSLGPPVPVPWVVGTPLGNARAALTAAGLTVGDVGGRFDATPLDQVLDQAPVAGTPVDPGTAVALVVSDGVAVVVPYVVGRIDHEAAELLMAQGLTVRLSRRQDSHPRDTVLDQSPTAGTPCRRGTEVALGVSAGEVTLPPVVGDQVAVASQKLWDLFLTVKVVEVESNLPKGQVIDQKPDAGTVVSGDSTVVLTVARPPQSPVRPVLVPRGPFRRRAPS